MSIAEQIVDYLIGDDLLLASAVVEAPSLPAGPPAVAAAGPRAAADPNGYRYALEAIREGHRLHYNEGLLISSSDQDLALLAGDRLYAAGLERMAAIGDLEAVSELSNLIQRCAMAAAEGSPDAAEQAWQDSCELIGGVAGGSDRAGIDPGEDSVLPEPL